MDKEDVKKLKQEVADMYKQRDYYKNAAEKSNGCVRFKVTTYVS